MPGIFTQLTNNPIKQYTQNPYKGKVCNQSRAFIIKLTTYFTTIEQEIPTHII